MPVWARVVTAVAALRVAVAGALYLSGANQGTAPISIPAWAYAALSFAFALVGMALVGLNKRDVRASWLGGVLILIAVPLTGALLIPLADPVNSAIDHVRPDAFLAAFLWRFLAEFPSPLSSRRRTACEIVSRTLAVLGLAAALVNLSIALAPASGQALGWRAVLAIGQGSAGSVYWPLVVLLPSAMAFAGLMARMVFSTGADRHRTRIFISGLAGGVLPFFIEVIVEESWPAYKAFAHDPAVEPMLGLVLFGTLAVVPFVTAYSVVFDRIVEMRLIVRAAIQYGLARVTILVLTAVPFGALGLYSYQHRSEPLVALLSGSRPLSLTAAIAAGIAALRWRRRVLHVIDRRFFREEYDTQLLFTRLIRDELLLESPSDIARGLSEEIQRTLHARADLFVVDDSGAKMVDPRAALASLDVRSTVVALALGNAEPMDISVMPGSPLERLSEHEKRWIEEGNYRLIVALRAGTGDAAGLIAVGLKRSGLPFSTVDRQSLGALASPLALALENHRLRQSPEMPTESAARECGTCSRLHAWDAVQCTCGGALTEAVAPHLLRGVFRFDRRIGAGGMGVVYLARDINLNREVAIKTLPQVTPEHVARLRREAQAMASIVHANLAVIYGVETWRGIPFLIEEYLAGGTLGHRLQRKRMEIAAAIDLGITLSSVLEQLHHAGVVHCDIKPGNIGYSQNGVVKLLDFGLAHMLRESGQDLSTTISRSSPRPAVGALIVTDRGVMGTPPYMSPEAIRTGQPDPHFDLWALAVVLFEAIAGRRPFVGETSHEVFDRIQKGLRPDVTTLREDSPLSVARFFDRALSLNVSERPATATALMADLFALRSSLS